MGTMPFSSPIGEMLLAAEDGTLVGAWFVGQAHFPLLPPAPAGDAEVLCSVEAWLRGYFAGENPSPRSLPIALRGSEFQTAVWQELLAIPYGETTTYGAIAAHLSEKLGRRVSARAVGNAVARNPVSIVVPCHRVIGANGSLTGYAGGIDRKEWLLRHEREG